ncbi:MAG: hypothetical protein KME07_01025 [Pegethrix bostrychoides GSE-TBD4-15B]|jgi:hypothetical protein|uniref:Uncharacterized protein n=1 Tax=Pegethrix bostrychoides GSE-TBD4-15B TaxID=2839662 RepID=A0A951U2W0_9CYAN|nr:hypothetical protein [Pegethrix bostrychoides GSE-TBD4-15B]
MLAIVHNGVAFPLFWWILDKKGNFNIDERIDLLGEVFPIFPDVKVANLTADRDVLGGDWFEYLLKHAKVPFRIRTR